MLVVFRGLPGTGKTHLVRRITRERPGFLVLSRDTIRVGMIPRPTFDAAEKALVDDLVVSMAGFLLRRGRDVLIDGMALSSAGRVRQFLDTAAAAGAPALVVECTCAEATALERLARDRGGHPAGDRGEDLYHEVKARWEAVDAPVLRVATDGAADAALAAVMHRIGDAGRDQGGNDDQA